MELLAALLIVAVVWSAMVALVVGLCAAARTGDLVVRRSRALSLGRYRPLRRRHSSGQRSGACPSRARVTDRPR